MSSTWRPIWRFFLLAAMSVPSPPFTKRPWKILWALWSNLSEILIYLTLLSTSAAVLTSSDDLAKLCATMYPVNVFFQTCLRDIYFLRKKGKAVKLAEKLQEIMYDNLKYEEILHEKMTTTSTGIVNKLYLIRYIVDMSSVSILTVAITIKGLIGPSRTTIINEWLPFDTESLLGFLLLIIFQSTSILLKCAKSVSVENYTASMIALVADQQLYLAKVLKRILLMLKEDKEQKFEMYLKLWVRHHQRTLELLKSYKSFVTPLLIINYASVLLALIFVSFPVLTNHAWTPGHKIVIGTTSMLSLIQLLLLCRVADYLEDMEEAISRFSYCDEVIDSKKHIVQAALIIAARSQKRSKLTVYGLYPVSSKTFSTLLHGTFSVWVAILQIERSKLGNL